MIMYFVILTSIEYIQLGFQALSSIKNKPCNQHKFIEIEIEHLVWVHPTIHPPSSYPKFSKAKFGLPLPICKL